MPVGFYACTMKIVTVAQMRALEAAAVAAGSTEADLQAEAAEAVADEVLQLAGSGSTVLVLAGKGNNGRDGLLAADRLIRAGIPTRCYPVGSWPDAAQAPGIPLVEGVDALRGALAEASIVVDAVLGIGSHGAARGAVADALRELQSAKRQRPSLTVVAVDLPSGVDAESGAVEGDAVAADVTVVLGAVKAGLLRFPAAAYVGRLVTRPLPLPDAAVAPLPFKLMDEVALRPAVPVRSSDAHKYRFGRVLAVAGAPEYPGAAFLCAAGAARAGAGLVQVAAPARVRQIVAPLLPEATHLLLERESDPVAAAELVQAAWREGTVVLLGPGLGRSPATQQFVRELLSRQAEERPHGGGVIDADGLHALSRWPNWWHHLGENAILTPHEGELARLDPMDGRTDEPPWERAARLARAWGITLVAKGPFTSIASADGRCDVWPRANAALATAGTGDVLAGVCAGLLAQGASPWDAARLAVAAHARAAEAIINRNRWRSLLASDLLPEIPRQLHELSGG